MFGGRRPGVMVLACLVCAACDGLAERPGHDFSMRALADAPIQVTGQIYAPVPFAVDGCDAFDLALDDGSGVRRALGFSQRLDGTFEALVPAAWLRGDRCVGGERGFGSTVVEGTLVATCQDAGRSATAGFSLALRFDVVTHEAYGVVRAIFAGEYRDEPRWIATSEVGGEVHLEYWRSLRAQWGPALNPAAYLNPLVRPRLATSGQRAFATLGCGTPADCPPVVLAPGESVPSERLADIGLSDRWGVPPRGVAHVSSHVVDMAFAADGALVVVSDSGVARSLSSETGLASEAARWGEIVVWRVVPAPEGSEGVAEDAATVIGRFPSEAVVSRLSRTAGGALAFVTLAYPGPIRGPIDSDEMSLQLHVTDGSSVTTSYSEFIPDFESCRAGGWYCGRWLSQFATSGVYLSPDAEAMILTQRGDEWLYWMNTDPLDLVWQPFGKSGYPAPITSRPRQPLFDPRANGGAAWLPGAVALWSGGDLLYPVRGEKAGIVQVFEDAPVRVLRYEYVVEPLPGATTAPVLVGVAVVGDRLVLTTTTGVRILDAMGTLVGGVDPLPCGAIPTSTAEPIGPRTVAVGVGSAVLRFDVGP